MARTRPVEQETFDVYADPGHAWVKVPKDKLRALGIAYLITPYSYQRGEFAYLEEDADQHTFANAMWEQRGIIVKYREHIADKLSRIRNYDHYDPSEGAPDSVAEEIRKRFGDEQAERYLAERERGAPPMSEEEFEQMASTPYEPIPLRLKRREVRVRGHPRKVN